ncbi:MAG: hypothetical protein WCI48_09245 [Bacteroidota bacterium]
MKSGFIDLIGKARNNRGEKFRHQLYIFLVCLILSVFIWSLVRLSREYYYTINYRIHYINLPSNLRMTGSSDSILTISIRVQGFDYFTEEFLHARSPRYNVSLRKIKVHSDDGQVSGYLPTTDIGREIRDKMNFQSEVYMVLPDTLFFDLERVVPKKVQKITARPAEMMAGKHDSLHFNKAK